MERQAQTTMGTMIATLRKEHGMTQAELAEQMGVTDKAVSKWERDLSCPDIGSLPRLADILGVSLDELMRMGTVGGERPGREKVDAIVTLVLQAVALAMGVAVVVLSVLRKLELNTGFQLLGIGLVCSAIHQLRARERAG